MHCPGGKQVQTEDPDGNPIELFEPLAAEKAQDRTRLPQPAVQLDAFEFLHLSQFAAGDTFEINFGSVCAVPHILPQ